MNSSLIFFYSYLRSMRVLYTISVRVVAFFLRIIALFNPKIRLFVTGRKHTFEKLSLLKAEDKVVWLHAASLGEFEQGRPILEAIKKDHPSYKIVLSFFSPSGYEVRKNYELADVVCYLPMDTPKAMHRFVQQVHPSMAIIVKYEFWPAMLTALKNHEVDTLLVSGIFRPNQSFFKWYGAYMRSKLTTFSHFFLQNERSLQLINSIGFNNASLSGDTRFDRVTALQHTDNTLPFLKEFKGDHYLVMAGSSWPEDEQLFINYINEQATADEKFVFAPHTIKPEKIKEFTKALRVKTVCFSDYKGRDLSEYQVFVLDTIGLLTKAYSYADVAYVGGGLATGLHNILEPATFGIPVIFGGVKYDKFQEAHDLLALKGASAITDQQQLNATLIKLRDHADFRNTQGSINKKYITDNKGATVAVMNYINQKL